MGSSWCGYELSYDTDSLDVHAGVEEFERESGEVSALDEGIFVGNFLS